jgi:hypothetical protein
MNHDKNKTSWLAAIKRVLSESDEPLHYSEISSLVLSRGYHKSSGATPSATVNAQISSSIKHDGEKSAFVRVDRGTFALRSDTKNTSKAALASDKDTDADKLLIHSFGMYWERRLVNWTASTQLIGKELAQSKRIDFGNQRGIYILYDHRSVVYVGRTLDRPLGRRLFEHTTDRLTGRWDRFSWFGLMGVDEEGSLKDKPINASLASLVTTMEAVLIESLEPTQNRKRGDGLSGIEYIQGLDPKLQSKRLRDLANAVDDSV